MRYLPHTDEDIQIMMDKIGVASLEEIFPTVPPDCRLPPEKGAGSLCEIELRRTRRARRALASTATRDRGRSLDASLPTAR